MKARIGCPTCGHEQQGAIVGELTNELSVEGACEFGHQHTIVLAQPKFQILAEFGALALLDGYGREAVSSFAAALERFYEFYIDISSNGHGLARETLAKSWKIMTSQSERQLGALVLLVAIDTNKPWPTNQKSFENNTKFRNKVIHQGLLPTEAEARDYCQYVYRTILELGTTLRTRHPQFAGTQMPPPGPHPVILPIGFLNWATSDEAWTSYEFEKDIARLSALRHHFWAAPLAPPSLPVMRPNRERLAFLERLERTLARELGSQATELLFSNFDWTMELLGTAGLKALCDAFESLPEAARNDDIGCIHQAFVMSENVIGDAGRSRDLPAQLSARLGSRSLSSERIRAFCQDARRDQRRPIFVPEWTTIAQAGGPLIRSRYDPLHFGSHLATSGDGSLAASDSFAGNIVIWNVSTGEIVRRLDASQRFVSALALSNDGSIVAFSSQDGRLTCWHDELTWELHHSVGASSLTFDEDANAILAGFASGGLSLISTASGAVVASFPSMDGPVQSLAISNKDQKAYAGSLSGTVSTFDIVSRDLLKTISVADTGAPGRRPGRLWHAMSADGRIVASIQYPAPLNVWDVESGALLGSCNEGHRFVSAIHVNADGSRCITGGPDAAIDIWDLRTRTLATSLYGQQSLVKAVTMTSDSKRALSLSLDCTTNTWDLDRPSQASRRTHRRPVAAVTFSTDGLLAISGGSDLDNRLVARSVPSGDIVFDLESDSAISALVVGQHDLIATGGDDGTIRIWTPSSRTCHLLGPSCQGKITALALLANDATLVSGGYDKKVRTWDLASGEMTACFDAHDAFVMSLAVSQDGRFLVTASTESDIKLWELETNKFVMSLESATMFSIGRNLSVAVQPGNATIAAGGQGKNIKLFSMASGRLGGVLLGHQGEINSVAFSPDGQSLISSSSDNTIRLWQTGSNSHVATFTGDGHFTCAQFSPTGDMVVAGDMGGHVHLLFIERRPPTE